MGISAEAVVVKSTVILHLTVGHTKCVSIQAKNTGPKKTDTKRTRCGVTRFQKVKENAPERSDQ